MTTNRSTRNQKSMDSRSAAAIIALLICSLGASAKEHGRLIGQVVDQSVDPSRAWISDAAIRLLTQTTRSTRSRTTSGLLGNFRIDGVEPGIYAVAISARGFRERIIDSVRVNQGQTVDLGKVRLEIASCDAPGIICDSFSAEPAVAPSVSSGDVELQPACTLDLDKGQVVCTVILDAPPAEFPLADRKSDLWLHRTADHEIYLEPRNGARLAEPNAIEADCRNAVFLTRPVRIDGLGPGSDVCVRTNQGRISQMFLKTEIGPDSERIALHYVTRNSK